jgi:integrase
MQTFLVHFIANHVNQLSVKREMTGIIRRYFPPILPYSLAEITPLIIEAWFHEIGRHSHAQANKSLSILRTCFEKAKDWRLFMGDNPAQRVKKYPKHERDRFVTPEEMPRLQAAIAREHEQTQAYFLLCLLTGCRRNEALDLKWTDINFASGMWRKAHTKTRRPQLVPIPVTLLNRLAALPRTNEWVFATSSKRGHWCHALAFQRWEAIRKAAGLSDVTIHDLRRTCASWLAIHGENMAVVKDVLNHTTLANTSIYARLNASPVTRALEENSARMMGGSHVN